MTAVRVAVFSRQGTPLVDVQHGALPRDDESDFRGLLSILDPLAAADSPFLFSMKLGPFLIDVSYHNTRYVFSIISASVRPPLSGCNPVFSWFAGLCFSQLVADIDASKPVPQQTADTFFSMIPPDSLNSVHRHLAQLLIAGVNYVAFVAQGHHVLLSLGETKMPTDRFVFAWCAALESMEKLKEQAAAGVAEWECIAVARFVECVRLVIFFADRATQARLKCFVAEVESVKAHLAELFVSREMRPQMPQAPKEGKGPRRAAVQRQ